MSVNVQHDCLTAKCIPSLNAYEFQEREQTQRRTMAISHADEDHFVLNVLALHNAHQLARLLPRELTQASPLVADRTQHHQVISKRLREIVTGKHELSKAKRQLTKSLRSGGPSGVAGKKRPYQAVT
jgi:hypothetical protein